MRKLRTKKNTENEIFILCKLDFISKHFIMLKHKPRLSYKMKQINYIDVCVLLLLIVEKMGNGKNKRYKKKKTK